MHIYIGYICICVSVLSPKLKLLQKRKNLLTSERSYCKMYVASAECKPHAAIIRIIMSQKYLFTMRSICNHLP